MLPLANTKISVLRGTGTDPYGDEVDAMVPYETDVPALLTEEARIDTAARLKIANQRKIIMEGSQEWEILYRKYYNDEVRKLGI